MPLKRYPDWKPLDFELKDRDVPIVTQAEDDAATAPSKIEDVSVYDPAGESVEALLREPAVSQKPISPLLFCQESIRQEIQELQKRTPNYTEFQEKRKPEQYHEMTYEERLRGESIVFVTLIFTGFVLPHMVFAIFLPDYGEVDPVLSFLSYLYLAIYFVLAILIFAWDYKSSHKNKKWDTSIFIEEIVVSFGVSGPVSCVIFLICMMILCLLK